MEAIATRDASRVGQLLGEEVDTFDVKRTTVETFTVRKGWGVVVSLVYRGENDEGKDEDEAVAFDAFTVAIDASSCTFLADGVLCVKVDTNSYVPVENFGDDENDLAASRFFPTRGEAEDHVTDISRALSWRGLESY